MRIPKEQKVLIENRLKLWNQYDVKKSIELLEADLKNINLNLEILEKRYNKTKLSLIVDLELVNKKLEMLRGAG